MTKRRRKTAWGHYAVSSGFGFVRYACGDWLAYNDRGQPAEATASGKRAISHSFNAGERCGFSCASCAKAAR